MINIIGLILLIAVVVIIFRTAREYGRSGIVWALITFVTGFVIQIIVPGFILFFIALAATVSGSSTSEVQDSIPIVTISMACIVLSFVACFLILRHVSQIPEERPFEMPPAPPTDFNLNS